MKSLSIKNPWALLIAHGIKDIENRTWPTTYRGRIYIHVSGKLAAPKDKLGSLFPLDIDANIFDWYKWAWQTDYKVSAIIGEVDIIDCVQRHASVWAEHSAVKLRKVEGEMIPVNVPVWNWVLAYPVLYDKPIENVKGALSLWEYQP